MIKQSILKEKAEADHTSSKYGKLHVTFAKTKSYICGSLCQPKHIVTVHERQSKNHRELIQQCLCMAMKNMSKDDIKSFVSEKLAMQ